MKEKLIYKYDHNNDVLIIKLVNDEVEISYFSIFDMDTGEADSLYLKFDKDDFHEFIIKTKIKEEVELTSGMYSIKLQSKAHNIIKITLSANHKEMIISDIPFDIDSIIEVFQKGKNNIKTEFRSMFREYDIRGRVSDVELNERSVYNIIKAYATFLRRRNINSAVIGYDNRSCSEMFAKSAIDALRDSGIDVYYIGLSISPVVYFAQYLLNCEGAVMITASHNPDGWSGFKLGKGLSKTLEAEEVKEIFDILINEDFYLSEEKGKLEVRNVREDYISAVLSRININPNYKPKVVIDAGNGGAGLFAYEIFQKMGCITFQLNCDPDMTYPHYFPNPSNMKAREMLKSMVTHSYIQADIGIGFDGDGDRIGVLDENGDNIWSDKILMMLARQLLNKKSGAKIVYDVKCTQALDEDIKEHGGIPIMWKTGHSYIKAKMHEVNAELAGERSGHIFVGGEDYYGFDDAIFVAAKLIEFISYEQEKVSEILKKFPSYITSPEIKVDCADEIKYDLIEKITEEFKNEYGDRVIDINGARVVFEDGWGLVRASSNLPELVLIFEAKENDRLLEIREIFKKKLDKYDEVSKEWENDIV